MYQLLNSFDSNKNSIYFEIKPEHDSSFSAPINLVVQKSPIVQDVRGGVDIFIIIPPPPLLVGGRAVGMSNFFLMLNK